MKFHLSMNVSDIDKAVKFFERLFQRPAAKHRPDYAKFELDAPPLVLSLEPLDPTSHGSLNHVGFRFDDEASLNVAQAALATAGINTQREDEVECCYSKQSKFWVHDLDQRLWEFYVLGEDIDHRGGGQAEESMTCEVQNLPTTQHVKWEHRMGSPLLPPESMVDEILLRGSFNTPVHPSSQEKFLRTVVGKIKPGGKLELHMLTSEQPIAGPLELLGAAQYVKAVPVRCDLMRLIEDVGLVDMQLHTFRSSPCFIFQDQPLRETRLIAKLPAGHDKEDFSKVQVVYKGPFKRLVDDRDCEFERGQTTEISATHWAQLSASPYANQFVQLPSHVVAGNCGVS